MGSKPQYTFNRCLMQASLSSSLVTDSIRPLSSNKSTTFFLATPSAPSFLFSVVALSNPTADDEQDRALPLVQSNCPKLGTTGKTPFPARDSGREQQLRTSGLQLELESVRVRRRCGAKGRARPAMARVADAIANKLSHMGFWSELLGRAFEHPREREIERKGGGVFALLVFMSKNQLIFALHVGLRV